jgi:uroporphyrinogen decarboxylase
MPSNSSLALVLAAIVRRNPWRIPIEDLSLFNESDVVGVGFEPFLWKWKKIESGVEECVDLFGCVRRRQDKGIGEIYSGPLASWDDHDKFQLPDIELLKNQTEQQLAALPPNKFVLGDLGQCLYKVFELRGFSNAMLDLAACPEIVTQLVMKLSEFAIQRIRMYKSLRSIHAISMYDDWGAQSSMLISPQQWRAIFLPLYKDIFDVVHQCGMYVYFHCCGAINPIIPDLIVAGVDILNFDQPRLHGIANLAVTYGSEVTFCCPVDIQATLPTGNKEAIKSEAIELVRCLHHQGGFIAKIYRDWSVNTGGFDAAEYSKSIFKKTGRNAYKDGMI